jgi:hypothetical protein
LGEHRPTPDIAKQVLKVPKDLQAKDLSRFIAVSVVIDSTWHIS